MNEVLIYHDQYDVEDSFDYFQSLMFGSQLKYLASDLLNEGLTMEDVEEAIHRAMLMSRSAGMNLRKHFMPIYVDRGGAILRDCKTSRLGLAMILLNTNPEVAIAGKFQLKVLGKYIE